MGFLSKLFGGTKRKTPRDPEMVAMLNARETLDHPVMATLVAVALNERDEDLVRILDTKKIHCLFCNAVVERGMRDPPHDMQISCPACGKAWYSLK